MSRCPSLLRASAALLAAVFVACFAGAPLAQVGMTEDSDAEVVPDGSESKPIAGKAEEIIVQGRYGAPIVERLVHVLVPSEGPKIKYTFTERGGTLRAAILQDPRFTREADPPLAGVPDDRLAAGPIDLVSTWSPVFLPFRVVFRQLEAPGQVTVVARRGRGETTAEGVLPLPGDRGTLAVDRPVRIDDDLVLTSGGDPNTIYKVLRVDPGGGILTEPTLPVSTAVAYDVRRTGTLADLWAADSTFTRVSPDAGLPVRYVWPDPRVDTSPVYVEKRFDAGRHPYELKLRVTIHNMSSEPAQVLPGLRVAGWQHPGETASSMFSFPHKLYAASCYTGDSLERVEYPSLVEGPEAFQTQTTWVGVDTRYFIVAAAADRLKGTQCEMSASPAPPAGTSVIQATMWTDAASKTLPGTTTSCVPEWLAHREGSITCAAAALALGHDLTAAEATIGKSWQSQREDVAGEERQRLDDAWGALKSRRQRTYSFSLYTGPKDEARLKETGHELAASMDFGLLAVVAEPLVFLLRWFHSIAGHWAIAILLLTILLKLLLLPLTNKSFQNMQKMATLRPEMEKIQKEFKDDREGAGKAQMALFKREKVNPVGGCLPMLLQMPIWFALYRVILSSVDLYHAPLGFWINDLSASDPYYVLPVILGFLMLAQSAVTPTPTTGSGGQQKFLKYGMPVMFSVFMVALPSGLVLYILTNTVLTIIQNLVIRRRMA